MASVRRVAQNAVEYDFRAVKWGQADERGNAEREQDECQGLAMPGKQAPEFCQQFLERARSRLAFLFLVRGIRRKIGWFRAGIPLANAFFKATGKRQRDLPFFPNATMGD